MTRRTYWHLEANRRVPDAYEIGTSQLLYYRAHGFEVATPIDAWYATHQRASLLAGTDWERFRDPRSTTYASYVELQRAQEIYVDGLFDNIDTSGHDRGLSPAALELHATLIAPLRYPLHALQMVAAYLGSLAPGGRLVVAFAFQAGDELRRVQRLAYRLHQLRDVATELGADARARWEGEPRWQPLRELVEHLLVTYDFTEAMVALGVAVKPAIDRLIATELAARLAAAGDTMTPAILAALELDCVWHRAWLATALAVVPEFAPQLEAFAAPWRVRARLAIEALG